MNEISSYRQFVLKAHEKPKTDDLITILNFLNNERKNMNYIVSCSPENADHKYIITFAQKISSTHKSYDKFFDDVTPSLPRFSLIQTCVLGGWNVNGELLSAQSHNW